MMRLRLLRILASVLLMCLVFSPPAFAVATQCGIHQNNGWRCAKDNYQADTLRIRNISDGDVSFNVGQWTSTCGKKGTEFGNDSYDLNSGNIRDIPFGSAKANQCLETFVYNCNPGLCKDKLSIHPL